MRNLETEMLRSAAVLVRLELLRNLGSLGKSQRSRLLLSHFTTLAY
jgi:hypothetical protein